MINFNKYDGDPYLLFEDALNCINNSDVKDLIVNNKQKVKNRYNQFHDELNINNIEHIEVCADISDNAADALRNMYSSKCKIVKDFRKWFDDSTPGTYYRMCPYCTINQADTIDHILPQKTYPEFAINVHNLIPACSACNRLKGKKVLNDNNEKIIINYYTDTLPDVQYLFAEFRYDEKGKLECEYRLENPNNIIDDNIYSLLLRHYRKLDLLNRLNARSINLIESLVCDFEGYNYEETAEYIKSKCGREKEKYGINYWKIVLYLTAVESPVFKDYVINHASSGI